MPTAIALGEPRPERRARRRLLPPRHLGHPARDLDREHRGRRSLLVVLLRRRVGRLEHVGGRSASFARVVVASALARPRPRYGVWYGARRGARRARFVAQLVSLGAGARRRRRSSTSARAGRCGFASSRRCYCCAAGADAVRAALIPMDQDRIRNFSIIAHIDHGKSTLADRILELTDAVAEREMREQVLDSMELERERGITIKAQAVRVLWKGHELNLIDTPGHVDFTYEVSRSLQACEGALLVVDAAQGIEAQTLANAYLAIENDLEIVPVVNKIDLPQADPGRRRAPRSPTCSATTPERRAAHLGEDRRRASRTCSTRSSSGSRRRRATRTRRRARSSSTPRTTSTAASSRSSASSTARFATRRAAARDGAGHARSRRRSSASSSPARAPGRDARGRRGRLRDHRAQGRLAAARRRHAHARARGRRREPLPGYKDVKPMVFAGLFPTDSDDYPELRDALERLKLNDARALLRAGDVAGARLRLPLRLPRPAAHGDRARAARARVRPRPARDRAERRLPRRRRGPASGVEVHNPAEMPRELEEVEEPYIKASMIVPKEYVGAVMELAQRAARHASTTWSTSREERVQLVYELPLGEIVLDFYDQLKSRTRGYASFDYDLAGFRPGELVARRHPRRRRAGRRALADHPPRRRLRPRHGCSSSGCARRSRARCSTCRSRRRSARA